MRQECCLRCCEEVLWKKWCEARALKSLAEGAVLEAWDVGANVVQGESELDDGLLV